MTFNKINVQEINIENDSQLQQLTQCTWIRITMNQGKTSYEMDYYIMNKKKSNNKCLCN